MYRRTELMFLLLQLALIHAARNGRIDYKELLVKDRIEEKFELIGPRALLKNFDFNRASNECARDLAVYRRGISRKETWAMQMLDSSSKLPTGILRGNVIDIGMFDQCIETLGVSVEGIEIRGQHCMYSIDHMITLEKRIFYNPSLSICMPRSCTGDDLFQLINASISFDANLTSLGMSVASADCSNMDRTFFDRQLIIFAIIMSLYIGFLLACTALHLKNSSLPGEKRNNAMKTMLGFSYLRNANAIFRLETSKNDLPVIHGLRTLSTLSLIILHEVFLHLFVPLVNFMDLSEWLTSWIGLVPLMCLYAVDTFLALSGFLIASTFFKQRQKNASFDIFSFYVHRFLRLAPSVAAVLYITILLVPKISFLTYGPRFDFLIELFAGGCQDKWLSILLFIPNLVKQDNHCLQHFWSISVDMQLMWSSPLILFTLYKKPRTGVYLLVSLLLASVLSYAYILGINNYSAIYVTHEPSMPTMLESFQNIYEMPHTRASPWLIGILFGYIASPGVWKSNKKQTRCGWLLAVASFAFCVCGTKTFTSEEYEYNQLWEITFAALSKPLWGFAICWIIYASIQNPRGFIVKLLSSKYYLPISRLSYSLCIVHVGLPAVQAAILKTPKYLSEFLILHSFLGNLVMDLGLAFLFSITFEMPMRNLGDKLFKGKNDAHREHSFKSIRHTKKCFRIE